MIELRAYQVDLQEQILDRLDHGFKTPLLSAPTGSGKSIIYACLIGAINPSTCLVVVPWSDLKDQIKSLLTELGIGHVQVETIQKVLLEPKQSVDLLLLDEAHHLSAPKWKEVFDLIDYKYAIGFTATPFRNDLKPLLKENGGPFDCHISGPSITELTSEGYLAKIIYRTVPLVQKLYKLPLYMSGRIVGYTRTIQRDPDDKTDKVVNEYLADYNGISALAFCKSIADTESVAQDFRDHEIAAKAIHSYLTKAQKKGIIEEFRAGKIQVLTCCNMVNEGFDLSIAKLAIMLKRVGSLGRFMQEVGRVLRPEGDQSAIVMDLVGNVYRHGKVENIPVEKLAR